MANFSPLIVGSIFPNNVPVIRLVWPHEQFWGFNSRETNRKLRGTTWKMDEGEEKRAKEGAYKVRQSEIRTEKAEIERKGCR